VRFIEPPSPPRCDASTQQSPQIYLHANMKTKEDALARTRPTGTKPGRYKVVDDTLLAFLQAL